MHGLYQSHGEADTFHIARELASELDGGTVILLFGELGVGKTVFVRGLVHGVGGEPDEVSSPTFTLIQPYTGPLTVQHVDLYRVKSTDIEDLGLDELSTPSAIVAIEWADRLPRAPRQAVCVYMEDKGNDEREIRIETRS